MKYRVHGEGVVLSDACYRASSREDTYNDDLARMGQAMPVEYPPLSADDAHRMVIESSDDVQSKWLAPLCHPLAA